MKARFQFTDIHLVLVTVLGTKWVFNKYLNNEQIDELLRVRHFRISYRLSYFVCVQTHSHKFPAQKRVYVRSCCMLP